MKAFITFALSLACVPNALAAANKSYCNSKYNYCVDYPTGFEPQGESDNGDGQVFESGKDLQAEITVFGRYNTDSEKPAQFLISMEKTLKKGGGSVTYKKSSSDSVVVSGYKDSGSTIYYSKVLFRDDRLLTLILTYPKSKREKMDAVVKAVSGSFK